MSNEPLDPALVEAARSGDRDAFTRLVERYERMVFAVCAQTCGRTDADDAAQETFIRAYAALPRLRKASLFTTWLYRMARNTAREWVRRARKHAADPLPDTLAAPEPAATPNLDRLLAAVGKLPDKYRLPLTMRYVQGLDYPQMARALGLREPSVRARVSRARKMVRSFLQQMPRNDH